MNRLINSFRPVARNVLCAKGRTHLRIFSTPETFLAKDYVVERVVNVDVMYNNYNNNNNINNNHRFFSSVANDDTSNDNTAANEAYQFEAETKQLLDIVINSLYTDKEVFVRELVSNASDALEKVRYLQNTNNNVALNDSKLEIKITTDEEKKTITIEDSGVGLAKEEMVKTLGTIARSGSKEFLAGAKADGKEVDIIGQFGVGFYSAFMVANKVEVVSTPAALDDDGQIQSAHKWISEGAGSYSIEKVDGTPETRGTKIIMHLRDDCHSYGEPATVRNILSKYSNFVPFPIALNGDQVNTIQAIWAMDKSSLTEEQYTEFYRYIANAWDEPQYQLHFKVDVPLDLKALFFIGTTHTEKFGAARMDPGVNLYSRKVLIEGNSENLLPQWMRFVKGAVDSEDIPLQISREGIQDSQLVKKISNVLTRRVIRMLQQEADKDATKYNEFFEEFGHFIKEGVVTDFDRRDDIAKLLRFETSSTASGEMMSSLDDYISRCTGEQSNIYYLAAPTRKLALASPYYEEFKREKVEVVFLYDPIDEFVVSNLMQYEGRKLISAESSGIDLRTDGGRATKEERGDTDEKNENDDKINKEMADWVKETLSEQVRDVQVTTRLKDSPAIIVDHESATIQRMMKQLGEQQTIAKQKLELNALHPINVGMFELRNSDPKLARLIAEQVFDNATVAAGVMEDPRAMLPRINELLEAVTKK